MAKQTITFAAVPNGYFTTVNSDGFPQHHLRVSVQISPRLVTDGPDGVLASFPDWSPGSTNGRTWPDSLASMVPSGDVTGNTGFSFTFADDGSGDPLVLPAVPVGTSPPDSDKWSALFGPNTLVQGHSYTGFDHRLVRSFPSTYVAEFLADRYGRFGFQSPESFPSYEDLVDPASFGPIGFEGVARGSIGTGVEDGPDRKARLIGAREAQLDKTSNSPTDWAIPLNANSSPDEFGSNFLEAEQFFKRDLAPNLNGNTPRPAIPTIDFHQMVAHTYRYHTLLRMLGLVVDFVVPDGGLVDGTFHQTTVQLNIQQFVPLLGTFDDVVVLPKTTVFVGNGAFRSAPQHVDDTDYFLRQLKLGDPSRFRLLRVDAAGGAVKARSFADTVTRSHANGDKRSSITSNNYALPSLRSGGIAINKLGRASDLASTMQRQADLNDEVFDSNNDKKPNAEMVLFEEDITRGHRIDVRDVDEGIWRSLNWREGQYHLLNLGASGDIPVVEESYATSSASSETRTGNNDLYTPETLTSWMGWSLAVPRVGKTLGLDDAPIDAPTDAPTDFKFTSDFKVPSDTDKRLPRLRFGHAYELRARAVDLAGNSLPVDNAADNGIAVSPPITYLRYEPVVAPRVLLHAPHTSGESNEVLVIRSENAADTTIDEVFRFVIPPRSAELLAEQHGAFDLLSQAGQPIDPSVWQDIADRDAAHLEDAPAVQEPNVPGSYYYPVDRLDVPYLPDVLARSAILRFLPQQQGTGQTTGRIPFEHDPTVWPKLDSFRLKLKAGAPNWSLTNLVIDGTDTNELEVNLAKGERLFTRLSCQFDDSDIDSMGVWAWIQAWANTHGQGGGLDDIRTKIALGEHWMFTPFRVIEFVHAVRTPLIAPALKLIGNKSFIGATFGLITGDVTSFSRKSTSQLDIVGDWQMPIDDGTNDDPDVEKPFSSHAFTLPVAHDFEPDAMSLDPGHRHEFGDTKYRKITYRAIATSNHTEFFREEWPTVLVIGWGHPITMPFPFEATTVRIDYQGTALQPAPVGTDPQANPAPGDYVLDEDASTIQATRYGRLQSHLPNDGSFAGVSISFVRPEIHNQGPDQEPIIIPNSRRPTAPKPLYVVPTFSWFEFLGSARQGGLLRVYLDRPWWSSGDEERLGVVCFNSFFGLGEPDETQLPFVTQWGLDPTRNSAPVPGTPIPSCFPMATAVTSSPVSIAENPMMVTVAGHDVGFDHARNLWYCDIKVTDQVGNELKSYFPFIRLALARYQPNSLQDCELSKIVLADFAQLTPSRFLTVVTQTNNVRLVTVAGRGYIPPASPGTTAYVAPIVRVTVQERIPTIPDDALAWRPAAAKGYKPVYNLTPSISDGNYITWQSRVNLPKNSPLPLRLLIEEFEGHARNPGPAGLRLVYTDTFPITT